MGKMFGVFFSLTLIAASATQLGAQKRSAPQGGRPERPLVQVNAIPLEGVKGRFDHFASGGGKLFVSELGNNSVAVINLFGETLEHTITGVPGPQGVAFSPEANKLFVASAMGKLYIYDGTSFDLITSIDFHGGADNLRYDPATRRVYVACGNDAETGAIAMVDAMTNHRLDEEYKLGGQPEAFQLETSGPNIYVNVPPLKLIAVINRTTKAITRWPLTGVEGNFPMAFDEADHRLFIGTQRPARLAVFDTNSGKMIAAIPSVQITDDLYYDSVRKRVYQPGQEGFVYVFQQNDPDHYHLLAKVPTALGAGTAGYFGTHDSGWGRKGFDLLYLAVPAYSGQSAEIRIYTVGAE